MAVCWLCWDKLKYKSVTEVMCNHILHWGIESTKEETNATATSTAKVR